MKKFLLLLLGVVLISGASFAQDGKKTFKKANRLLGTFNLDPGANIDKLTEAKTLIEEALGDAEVMAMPKAWILKGKIYNELIGAELAKKIIDPSYMIENLGDANIALAALRKGLELAEKPVEKKDAIVNLKATAGHISNAAITAFSDKDYKNAFANFRSSIDLNDLFIKQGEDPLFIDDKVFNEQIFYTAVSGYYAEDFDGVEPIFERALEAEKPDPFIFEGLYNIKSKKDKEAALAVLRKGREVYPDDTALLYAEINYMVAEGLLEELIEKLEDAVDKDPENISVYTTLGSVYDNLATKASEAGDEKKAQGHFAKSMEWFEKALAKDDQNFDALYSLGALYYNKAATYTEPLNELANDFSAEGNKKYDALKIEMDGLFEKAFPYFQKAEGINDKDMNTLLAIKEIYARKNELDKANEYKAKIEALQN